MSKIEFTIDVAEVIVTRLPCGELIFTGLQAGKWLEVSDVLLSDVLDFSRSGKLSAVYQVHDTEILKRIDRTYLRIQHKSGVQVIHE